MKDPSDFHNILGNKNDCWLGVGQSNFYAVDGGMEESGRVLWKCVSPLGKQDNSHGTSFQYTEKRVYQAIFGILNNYKLQVKNFILSSILSENLNL